MIALGLIAIIIALSLFAVLHKLRKQRPRDTHRHFGL